MGIFTEFMWMLAGGTYAAGKSLSNSLFPPATPTGPSEKNRSTLWYQDNWNELNHKRQRELGKIYRTNPSEYDALASRCQMTCHVVDPFLCRPFGSGTRFRNPFDGFSYSESWLKYSIQAIARYEGWKADTSKSMLVHMQTKYDMPTEQEEKLGIQAPPQKVLTTNPERESELYARIELAQMGVKAEQQYFVDYFNDDTRGQKRAKGCFNCGHLVAVVKVPQLTLETHGRVDGYCPVEFRIQDKFVAEIMEKEGFVAYALTPLYLSGFSARHGYPVLTTPGWTAIKDLIDQKTEELIDRYQDHERQEELLRMLHYASNGSKDAKRDFYTLIHEHGCMGNGITGITDIELLIEDAEQNKKMFGKNGDALDLLKSLAQEEGWLWDDCYPTQSRRMALDDTYSREKSYSDPTILPYNHERQEELFKARFKAAEQRDKESKDKLLAFTGTRNSHTMKEEKFFILCQTCAKDEDWSWDRTYLTPEKCREIIRQCMAEKTE